MNHQIYYALLLTMLSGCHFCQDEMDAIKMIFPTLGAFLAFSNCHIHNLIHKLFKKDKCKHEG